MATDIASFGGGLPGAESAASGGRRRGLHAAVLVLLLLMVLAWPLYHNIDRSFLTYYQNDQDLTLVYQAMLFNAGQPLGYSDYAHVQVLLLASVLRGYHLFALVPVANFVGLDTAADYEGMFHAVVLAARGYLVVLVDAYIRSPPDTSSRPW